MPKRKRNETEDVPGKSKPPNQISHLLEHGKKRIAEALELAQRFERQKLSRRLKAATDRQDNADVARINGEVKALRVLEISSTAERHLYKVLLRIKSVASSPALPQSVRTVSNVQIDNATGNIISRLFHARVTKDALDEVLSSVRQALGAVAAPDQRRKEQDAQQEKEILQLESTGRSGDTLAPLLENVLSKGATDQEEFKGVNDDEASSSSDDYAQYNHRLASSDDDAEDDGSLVREGPDSQLRNELQASLQASEKKMMSVSVSPQPEKKVESTKQLAMESTFLPSLTAGGYLSGSESDATDVEELVAPRKNRRGQRARQAIWEKKYGETAKHVQTTKKSSKNEGWDAKRGAVFRDKDGWRDGQKDKKRSQSDNPNLEEVTKKPKKRDDEGRLHPSWEAAKKAKEHKPTAAFQGKKIVFD